MLMHIALLRHKTSTIGPEERLFLASFSMRFQDGEAVSLTVRELSDSVGMPPRVVMRAVSRLASADSYLVVKKVSCGRGRPSRSYEISPEIRERLKSSAVSCPSDCLQVIDHLLMPITDLRSREGCDEEAEKRIGYKQPPVRMKSDQLSLANRWLLAVLVSHANEFGVVDELGMADLRQLTGMTEFRLKAQLTRLMDMGVIRSYAPGLSRSLFTGVRVRSSYVLDLSHPLLGTGVDRGGVVVIDEETEAPREVVIRVAGGVEPVLRDYFQRLSDADFDVFWHRLDGYASFLLSRSWKAPGRLLGADLAAELEALIGNDFQRPRGRVSGDLSIDEGHWLRVIEHFSFLAFERARRIQAVLMGMPDWKNGGVRIQLIPTPCPRITAVLVKPSPVPRYGCVVVKYEPWNVCELYEQEADLEIDDRHRFGLQARPKG